MVKKIRNVLRGFILLPGARSAVEDGKNGDHFPPAYLPEEVITRASALRGYTEKQNKSRLFLLPGKHPADVLRRLRDVVVEGERAPRKGSFTKGLNLVIFRGVFGSGGYSLEVENIRRQGEVLYVECNYESPGQGVRTTAGFTQPTAIVPLANLEPGKYKARLIVRELLRSARGVKEIAPPHETAALSFRIES